MNNKQFAKFLEDSCYVVPQGVGFLISKFANIVDEQTDIVLQRYLGIDWNQIFVFVYKAEGMILYVYRPLYDVAMERECFYFDNFYYEENYGGIYKRFFYELETDDNERPRYEVTNDMRAYVQFPLCQINYFWEDDMREFSQGIVGDSRTWQHGNWLNAQAEMELRWEETNHTN